MYTALICLPAVAYKALQRTISELHKTYWKFSQTQERVKWKLLLMLYDHSFFLSAFMSSQVLIYLHDQKLIKSTRLLQKFSYGDTSLCTVFNLILFSSRTALNIFLFCSLVCNKASYCTRDYIETNIQWLAITLIWIILFECTNKEMEITFYVY